MDAAVTFSLSFADGTDAYCIAYLHARMVEWIMPSFVLVCTDPLHIHLKDAKIICYPAPLTYATITATFKSYSPKILLRRDTYIILLILSSSFFVHTVDAKVSLNCGR